MQDISVKLLKQRITESKIYISENLANKLEISINSRTDIKTPKNVGDKTILLNIQLNIGTKDENLKIELNADLFFELEQLLDNYDEIAKEKLIPIASVSLLNSLDDILVSMGYKKMELANKIYKVDRENSQNVEPD